MPISYSVKADVKSARRYLTDIQRKVLPKVTVQSLNTVIKTAQVRAAREIKQERSLKIGVIKRSLTVVRATLQRQVARLIAAGKSIPLRDFGAKLSGRKGSKSVTVKIGTRRKQVRGAFIVEKIGGHVFRRKGDKRLPIEKLFGPSIPTAFRKASVRRALDQVIDTQWPKVFRSKLEFALSKLQVKKR